MKIFLVLMVVREYLRPSGGKYSTLNGADKLGKFCSFESCT